MRLITFLHPLSNVPQLGVAKKDLVYPFSSIFKSNLC